MSDIEETVKRKDDFSDLVSKLEAATDASRELDADIWLRCTQDGSEFTQMYRRNPALVIAGDRMAEGLPNFTSSVDAALILVPANKWWVIGRGRLQIAEKLYGAFVYAEEQFDGAGDPILEGFGESAATAAAAMCIAALRAIHYRKVSLQ